MIVKTTINGNQAGKPTFTGSISAQELVGSLRNLEIGVNSDAQRSLKKGIGAETTAELLNDDKIEITPRMKSIRKFYERVMIETEKGGNTEGFFGSLQFSIPDSFKSASVSIVQLDEEKMNSLPSTVHEALKVLDNSKTPLCVLKLSPKFGETAMYIGDGQGRVFGFHAFERAVMKEIIKLKKAIKRTEKANGDLKESKDELQRLNELHKRISQFLSDTHVSFVCYADSVDTKGNVTGLSEAAQKRMYIEGNALNSQATKEDIIKYESFSPVVIRLQEERGDIPWMSHTYIEDDSKNISSTSVKLFTLSALVQAYSFSIVAHNKPIEKVDNQMFEDVGSRGNFVSAFWTKVGEVFSSHWIPDPKQSPGDRLRYLQAQRGDRHRNVAFQAIFLLALGKMCFDLGKEADWDPDSPLLDTLQKLSPDNNDYDAVKCIDNVNGDDPKYDYVEKWTNRMMKPRIDKDTVIGYSFNNTGENVTATCEYLKKLIGFKPSEDKSESVEAA